jgi:hypothetical protein
MPAVKKERKSQDRGPNDAGKPEVFDKLPMDKWHRAYDREMDEYGSSPCWFACNRPGGCLNTDEQCRWSHKAKPQDYGGKEWAALGPDQRAIIEATTKAA